MFSQLTFSQRGFAVFPPSASEFAVQNGKSLNASFDDRHFHTLHTHIFSVVYKLFSSLKLVLMKHWKLVFVTRNFILVDYRSAKCVRTVSCGVFTGCELNVNGVSNLFASCSVCVCVYPSSRFACVGSYFLVYMLNLAQV